MLENSIHQQDRNKDSIDKEGEAVIFSNISNIILNNNENVNNSSTSILKQNSSFLKKANSESHFSSVVKDESNITKNLPQTSNKILEKEYKYIKLESSNRKHPEEISRINSFQNTNKSNSSKNKNIFLKINSLNLNQNQNQNIPNSTNSANTTANKNSFSTILNDFKKTLSNNYVNNTNKAEEPIKPTLNLNRNTSQHGIKSYLSKDNSQNNFKNNYNSPTNLINNSNQQQHKDQQFDPNNNSMSQQALQGGGQAKTPNKLKTQIDSFVKQLEKDSKHVKSVGKRKRDYDNNNSFKNTDNIIHNQNNANQPNYSNNLYSHNNNKIDSLKSSYRGTTYINNEEDESLYYNSTENKHIFTFSRNTHSPTGNNNFQYSLQDIKMLKNTLASLSEEEINILFKDRFANELRELAVIIFKILPV
jgi:hypothetical protein